MNQQQNSPLRFHALDVLRGLSALSVVIWHWQHFFYAGTDQESFAVSNLPFYDLLFPFYTKGWLAVDLFFSLSGFVFYWLYSRRVAEGDISPSQFALLRLSRLYPLHLATLLLVAVCQLGLMAVSGSYFVYPNNDCAHFIMNLALASSWGLERGFSFNGPVWSVSVEVLLYALFFFFCRALKVRVFILALIALFGFVVLRHYYHPIGRGVGSFFLGGCVYLAYQSVQCSVHKRTIAKVAVGVTLSAWSVTIIAAQHGVDHFRSLEHFIPRLGLAELWLANKIINAWPVVVLIPLTVLSLALAETEWGPLGKQMSFLGDISYSSYLLHFPLQLVFFAVLGQFTSGNSIYYSPWIMIAFFLMLIAISLISYRYFEVPVQDHLRQKWGRSKSHEVY